MKKGKRISLDSRRKKFTVYILYDEDEIVYVGKSSMAAEGRIHLHMEDPEKDFDSYELIYCDSNQEMNLLEAKMIFDHVPKYNKQLPTKYSLNLVYIGQMDAEDTKIKLDAIILKGKVYIDLKGAEADEKIKRKHANKF